MATPSAGLLKTAAAAKTMQMAKYFRYNNAPINSLDFSTDGEFVISSSDDESIRLYDCRTGETRGNLYSKKYGVDLVRFLPNQRTHVLCASKNGFDETVRFLSLGDNQYLRYFKGHRDRVISLAVCPKDELFATSSLDNTIRFWDTRMHSCQGLVHERPPAGQTKVSMPLAFDPEGLVMVAGSGNNMVKLFDRRVTDKGPFMAFTLENEQQYEWTYATFDVTGRLLLMSTTTNLIVLFDAITGEKLQEYTSFLNDLHRRVEATFSPAGEFVIAGSDDGSIHVWETLSGVEIAAWQGHRHPVSVVRWNPRMQMAASGCNQVALWLPRLFD